MSSKYSSKLFDSENDENYIYHQRPTRSGDNSGFNIFGDSSVSPLMPRSLNDREEKLQKNYHEINGKLIPPQFGSGDDNVEITNGFDKDNISNPIVNGGPHEMQNGYHAVGVSDSADDETDSTITEEINHHYKHESSIFYSGEREEENFPTKYVNRGGADSERNYKRNQRGMYNPITGESYD
ncbi:unnamed protein product [Gordionus sp. m RMFG-2023]|uniref:uncharacterized protein LOC135923458 n=1 Tax=Gordionus sp. m RMFG-2023 TaxID=3053472 RepID=UPI0030E5A7D6